MLTIRGNTATLPPVVIPKPAAPAPVETPEEARPTSPPPRLAGTLPPPPGPDPAPLPGPPVAPAGAAAKPTQKFPRSLTVLSVSWTHGRLEAVAINKGRVLGTWQRPEPCDEPARFGELIREAANKTGYGGNQVVLVLAHPRLSHQLVETPAAKESALGPLVRRQVERLKGFDGDAASAHQPALPTKTSPGVLVHVFPRAILDTMVASARETGFHLKAVYPPTAVLQAQLGAPLKPKECAVIAAETGASITILVGRGDGQILIGRSVDARAGSSASGLAVDLNRTLLFASQQFGANPVGVWWFGPSAATRIAELQPQIQLPITASPVACAPFHWAAAAAVLPQRAPNLVSSEQRLAPQRRVLLMTIAAIAAVFVVGAIATALISTLMIRRERTTITALHQDIARLTTTHQELQQQHARLNEQALVAKVLVDDRPAPVPLWILAYLSEAVPADLCVTNLEVRRVATNWVVRIGGLHLPASQTPAVPLATRVDEFARTLNEGPFGLSLKPPVAGTPAPSAPDPGKASVATLAAWAARLVAHPPTAVPLGAGNSFVLEGTLP